MRSHIRRRKALQERWLGRPYPEFQRLTDYTASMRGRHRHYARQDKIDQLKRVSFVHPTWDPDLAAPASEPFSCADIVRMNEIGRVDNFRFIVSGT